MAKRRWLFAAGCCVSAALLALILRRLDWLAFVAEIRQLTHAWLLGTMLAVAIGIALRSLRWNLAAGAPLAAYPAFWNSAVIGLAFNQLYPLRAGEVVRMFLLRRLAAVPLGQAATSAVIDRVADVLLLGILALALAAAHAGLPYADGAAAGTLAFACVVLVALAIVAKGDRFWGGWLMRRGGEWIPARFVERLQRFYADAVQTSAVVSSPPRLLRIIAITVVAFALDLVSMFCALRAFGWDLPPVAALTVLVFLALGTSLPSGPGYVGVYQIACVLALGLFGIAESSALAYSVVLQLCILATVVPLAAVAAVFHREEFGSIRAFLAEGR